MQKENFRVNFQFVISKPKNIIYNRKTKLWIFLNQIYINSSFNCFNFMSVEDFLFIFKQIYYFLLVQGFQFVLRLCGALYFEQSRHMELFYMIKELQCVPHSVALCSALGWKIFNLLRILKRWNESKGQERESEQRIFHFLNFLQKLFVSKVPDR